MKRAAIMLLAAGVSGAIAMVSRVKFSWLAAPGMLVGMLVHSGSATLTMVVTWLFYFGLFWAIALWREQRREQGVEAR